MIPSRDIDDKRTVQSNWTRAAADKPSQNRQFQMPTFLDDCLHTQKSKRLIDFSKGYWWLKNCIISLGESHNLQIQTEQVVPIATFAWWISPCKKNSKNFLDYFQTLMIKESWNLIRKEPQLADATKTKHFFDDYLYLENLRYCWISSSDIDDQRILQSDSIDERHNCSHPTKTGSLIFYLSLRIISMQKIRDTNWFLLEILMIKDSCSLTGQKVQLNTQNQKW